MADRITGHCEIKRVESEEFPVTRVYGTQASFHSDEREVSTTATIKAEFTDYQFRDGNTLYPEHFVRLGFNEVGIGLGDYKTRLEKMILKRFGEHVSVDLSVDSESESIGWNTYNNRFDDGKTYGEAILKFLERVELD